MLPAQSVRESVFAVIITTDPRQKPSGMTAKKDKIATTDRNHYHKKHSMVVLETSAARQFFKENGREKAKQRLTHHKKSRPKTSGRGKINH